MIKKYRPTGEVSTALLYSMCSNIGEDMKYVLDEIAHHNSYYPKNKITISYEIGSVYCEINDEGKDGEVNFTRTLHPSTDLISIVYFIRGYTKGLSAAGIRSRTPKEL